MNEPTKTETKAFVLKCYTRKELQHMYGVPDKTFRRWLEPYRDTWNLKRFKYFSVEQVAKIIAVYGVPTSKI